MDARAREGGRFARPDEKQRAALRGILAEVPRPYPGCALTLVYSRERRVEAAWLCAFARAAGTRVALVGTAESGRAAVEDAARAAVAAGAAVIVVADSMVSLPPAALHLSGVPGTAAVDLWEPRASTIAAYRRFRDALPPRVAVFTGRTGTLTATLGACRLGDLSGCADAEVATASGVFVAGCALGVNRAVGRGLRLDGHPVTLCVRDGRVVSVDCDDPVLHRFLARAFHVHRAAQVRTLRFGLRGAGAVNSRRAGIATLCLAVDADGYYNPASADLRIELSAALAAPLVAAAEQRTGGRP